MLAADPFPDTFVDKSQALVEGSLAKMAVLLQSSAG